MSQINSCWLRVGDVAFTEGELHHSNPKTMTYSTFQNEAVDEALRLEEMNDINGADLLDWINEKLGDGNVKHEWKDDYRDDAIKVGIWILEMLGSKQ